ncbi:MAG TPA: ion channel, partial [Chitinophagaceae bacterium]|nr:ion channel [Chitinophagaceae bacterium]
VNSENSSGRFYDRNSGGANVIKKGVSALNKYSWYHTMLAMPRAKFLSFLLFVYIIINFFFAGIYYMIGIEHLAGVKQGSDLKNFSEVFFFSAQTFTTVGYGRISPVGFAASAVSTFEAFLGLLSFALATGLFYGRFSRPRAFLSFSHNALIAPYKDGIALMFRMAPYKNNLLSEAEVKVNLAMQLEENGKMINRFFNLDLEISKINSLALSWTIVHPINEKSPLYNFNYTDIVNAKIEALVFVKAFDEVFSNTVVQRFSYISSEVVWGAKFRMMYHADEKKKATVLDLNKLNDYEKIELLSPVITAQ